jgi:hypothetical protein
MDDRISKLEKEIGDLAGRFSSFEQRLNALESAGLSAKAPALTATAAEEAPAMPAQAIGVDATGALALTGRLLIVIGGAYMLRALTEASALPASVGISLGLGYALCWVVASGRAFAKNRWLSGVFHGGAGALTAFPLIYESVTHFRIIRAPIDTWIMAGLTAAFLFIASRYRFQTLAWLAALGAVATTLALLPPAESMIPGTVFLILLGVATLWLGYELEWRGLRWLVAGAANLAVFAVTMSALASHPHEKPEAALFVQLFMLGLYLATIAVRTVGRARNIIPFEVCQVIATFLLGFVGAIYTTRITGIGVHVLGIAALVLGASCYAVAFAFMDRQAGRDRNFYFYTSLALLFTLTGTRLLLGGTALGLAWIVLAVVMTWLGWGHARFALILHATICIVAAAFASRIIAFALDAFVGPAAHALSEATPAHALVLAGTTICILWPLPSLPDTDPTAIRLQRLAAALVLIGGMGGTMISAAARLLASLPDGGADPGALATIRTVVLAIAALALAWMGRRQNFVEWGWLLYPALAVTGLKMAFEDFPYSRPSTLFLALVAYGCALILSPRLRRQPRRHDSEGVGGP